MHVPLLQVPPIGDHVPPEHAVFSNDEEAHEPGQVPPLDVGVGPAGVAVGLEQIGVQTAEEYVRCSVPVPEELQ